MDSSIKPSCLLHEFLYYWNHWQPSWIFHQSWYCFLYTQMEKSAQYPNPNRHSEALCYSISIPCQGRAHLHIDIMYQWLANFCYFCGFLGHKMISCLELNPNGDKQTSTPRFGHWIKPEDHNIPFFVLRQPTFVAQMLLENPQKSK